MPFLLWPRRGSRTSRPLAFAQAASTDVVTAFGDPGLGALAFLTAPAGLYFGGGFVDADANGKYPDFNSLGRGRFVYTGELGWEGKASGRAGAIRINYANAPTKTDSWASATDCPK